MPQKILIVDDDAELAEEMADILRDCGYLVEHTSDSTHGKDLIEENNYDIYLFDYKMAGLNGVDLLRKVKEFNKIGKIFIISGRPFIELLLLEEGVRDLVDHVIKKPFDIEMLLQKIKSIGVTK
jgi:DNA-binding response OmpR family regulator